MTEEAGNQFEVAVRTYLDRCPEPVKRQLLRVSVLRWFDRPLFEHVLRDAEVTFDSFVQLPIVSSNSMEHFSLISPLRNILAENLRAESPAEFATVNRLAAGYFYHPLSEICINNVSNVIEELAYLSAVEPDLCAERLAAFGYRALLSGWIEAASRASNLVLRTRTQTVERDRLVATSRLLGAIAMALANNGRIAESEAERMRLSTAAIADLDSEVTSRSTQLLCELATELIDNSELVLAKPMPSWSEAEDISFWSSRSADREGHVDTAGLVFLHSEYEQPDLVGRRRDILEFGQHAIVHHRVELTLALKAFAIIDSQSKDKPIGITISTFPWDEYLTLDTISVTDESGNAVRKLTASESKEVALTAIVRQLSALGSLHPGDEALNNLERIIRSMAEADRSGATLSASLKKFLASYGIENVPEVPLIVIPNRGQGRPRTFCYSIDEHEIGIYPRFSLTGGVAIKHQIRMSNAGGHVIEVHTPEGLVPTVASLKFDGGNRGRQIHEGRGVIAKHAFANKSEVTAKGAELPTAVYMAGAKQVQRFDLLPVKPDPDQPGHYRCGTAYLRYSLKPSRYIATAMVSLVFLILSLLGVLVSELIGTYYGSNIVLRSAIPVALALYGFIEITLRMTLRDRPSRERLYLYRRAAWLTYCIMLVSVLALTVATFVSSFSVNVVTVRALFGSSAVLSFIGSMSMVLTYLMVNGASQRHLRNVEAFRSGRTPANIKEGADLNELAGARVNDAVSIVSRAAAQQLEPELRPGLMAEVNVALAARKVWSGIPSYVDPVGMASLIVSIASHAWEIYADLRKRSARPSAEVIARAVRVELQQEGRPPASSDIVDVVVNETIHAADVEYTED